jgi:glutamine amidotransferase
MTIAVIDYGSGNLRSAGKAIEREARERSHKGPVVVTGDADVVASAERIVLPGVGAFADCMAGLLALDGMVEALGEAVLQKGRPFLGICVGMQLLATTGREHGDHAGLGWIGGTVERLTPADPALKIPHMGWNALELTQEGAGHPVLARTGNGTDLYFVHSYHFVPQDEATLLAVTNYGGPVAAVIGRDNIIGTQFHPEKSQRAGLRMIGDFLDWRP